MSTLRLGYNPSWTSGMIDFGMRFQAPKSDSRSHCRYLGSLYGMCLYVFRWTDRVLVWIDVRDEFNESINIIIEGILKLRHGWKTSENHPCNFYSKSPKPNIMTHGSIQSPICQYDFTYLNWDKYFNIHQCTPRLFVSWIALLSLVPPILLSTIINIFPLALVRPQK